MRVYLAGRVDSDWRDWLHLSKAITVLRPLPVLVDADQYTAADLYLIRSSAVVLAYMAEDNPSGIGLALEVGYAHALGKLVLFVDGTDDKRFGIVCSVADVVFDSLDEAVEYLEWLAEVGL